MRDWFEWNGARSLDYGVRVQDFPPVTLPQERLSFVDVPGRSGSLTRREGRDVYNDVTLTATCFCMRPDARAIGQWLRGGGTVRFANRPDGWYRAHIVNQIPLELVLRGRDAVLFDVQFRCQPFLYLDESHDVTLTEPGAIVNPGNVFSRPQIVITGSGAASVTVGGTTVNIVGAAQEGSASTPVALTATAGGYYDAEGNLITNASAAYAEYSGVTAGDEYDVVSAVSTVCPVYCLQYNGTTLISAQVYPATGTAAESVTNRVVIADGCTRIIVQTADNTAQPPELYLIDNSGAQPYVLTVDSDLMECYTAAASANSAVTMDDFPTLQPGANAITWTGDIASVRVTPNWRDLA